MYTINVYNESLIIKIPYFTTNLIKNLKKITDSLHQQKYIRNLP